MGLRYRLLALDIDGTLIDGDDNVSAPVRAALDRARAAGVEIVLATGRRYGKTFPIARRLGLTGPVITAGGALVKDPADHRTLWQAEFPSTLLAAVLREVAAAGHEPVMYGDTYLDGFDFWFPSPEVRSPELAEYLTLNAGLGRVLPDLVERPPAGIFAGFAMGRHEPMLQLEALLHAQFPGSLDLHVLRSPKYRGHMCEIAAVGVNKGAALLAIAAERGIEREAICAVGDDVNDVAMIRVAGLGVAMGNGTAACRAAADRVAPRLDEDGLVQVVDWILA